MKISAVIVTYNRLDLLKECIKCLLNQTRKINTFIIINNNSSDGTKAYLDKIHNNRFIIKNLSKNIGGAGGFSIGTRIAYEKTNSDYIWLMDDDSMPSSTALRYLCNYAELLKGNFGFLSSNIRWWRNDYPVNIPTVSKDWSKLISKSLIKLKESTFVSLFIPKHIVKDVGLPISKAFIWGDDTEYTHRISNRYPCYFVPSSVVFHKSEKLDFNENIFNESNKNRIRFYRFGYRNTLFLDKKYYSKGRFLKDLLIEIIDLCKIPFKAKNKRIERMYYTLIGLITGIFFNPTIHFPNNK